MTALVAMARHLPDPVQAPLRPAWRWLRRAARWFPRDGAHRKDMRPLLTNASTRRPTHKVRTLADDLNDLDPLQRLHLENRND